jgi:hypothetical protein
LLFWPPTHGISTTHGILTPYPWYIDPPTHGILTPLPMVYWPTYPWYFDPLPMVYWPPYPWYFDPPIHGILTPLPMVFWSPYPWYFEPPTHVYRTPTHGILTPLPIYWLEMRGVKIPWAFNLPYRGVSVFNKGGQFTMGVKIPYDTGSDIISIISFVLGAMCTIYTKEQIQWFQQTVFN